MFVGKYDVPAGVSAVRAFFHDSRLAKTLPPIKLFGLAKRYGWADEAATASIQSLALDLYSEDAQMQLSGLDTRSALDLINLHRSRRKDFLDALLAPTAPSTSTRPGLTSCGPMITYAMGMRFIQGDVDNLISGTRRNGLPSNMPFLRSWMSAPPRTASEATNFGGDPTLPDCGT